jgi:hypothetical protein
MQSPQSVCYVPSVSLLRALSQSVTCPQSVCYVHSVSLLVPSVSPLRALFGPNSQPWIYFQIFNLYYALYLRLKCNYVFHNGVKFSFIWPRSRLFLYTERTGFTTKQQLNLLSHPTVPAAELYWKGATENGNPQKSNDRLIMTAVDINFLKHI